MSPLTLRHVANETLILLCNFPQLQNVDFDNRDWNPARSTERYRYIDRNHRISVTAYLNEFQGTPLMIIECRFYVGGVPRRAAVDMRILAGDWELSMEEFSIRFLAPAVAAIGNKMIAETKGDGPAEMP